jgi:hypothetical protein
MFSVFLFLLKKYFIVLLSCYTFRIVLQLGCLRSYVVFMLLFRIYHHSRGCFVNCVLPLVVNKRH